jgi:hypothetical protein
MVVKVSLTQIVQEVTHALFLLKRVKFANSLVKMDTELKDATCAKHTLLLILSRLQTNSIMVGSVSENAKAPRSKGKRVITARVTFLLFAT